MRFWVSFEVPIGGIQPLSTPPHPQILGWWRGPVESHSSGLPIVAALVEAEDRKNASVYVAISWPHLARWRTFLQINDTFVPHDFLFPLADWMRERLGLPADPDAGARKDPVGPPHLRGLHVAEYANLGVFTVENSDGDELAKVHVREYAELFAKAPTYRQLILEMAQLLADYEHRAGGVRDFLNRKDVVETVAEALIAECKETPATPQSPATPSV